MTLSSERYLRVLFSIVCVTLVLCLLYWSPKYAKLSPVETDFQRRAKLEKYNLFQRKWKWNNKTCAKVLSRGNNGNDSFRCTGKRVTNIAFLKVHKAGSSTLSNIFFRFGLKNSLTFAVPDEGTSIRYVQEVLPDGDGTFFDILAVHTVFDKRLYDNLVSENAVKVGIVREPLDRTISAAYFFRDKEGHEFLQAVRKEMFIETLLSKPTLFGRTKYSIIQNSMALDFGFQKARVAQTNDSIQAYLRYLDSQFSIVLVLELFDESLIMLRRMFNWSLSDILYTPLNIYVHDQVNVSQDVIDKFRKGSSLDYSIYEFFRGILETKICQAGSEFQKEVAHFKTVLNDVLNFCTDKTRSHLTIQKSPWNEELKLSRKDCHFMKLSVSDFRKILKLRPHYYNT